MLNRLRQLLDREKTANSRKKTTRKANLRLEALEERQLLSASVTLGSDRVLRIAGSDAADHIRVWKYSPITYVYDNGNLIWGTGNSHYTINSVSIDGRGGSDTLQVQNPYWYDSNPYNAYMFNRPLPSVI